MAGFTPVTSMIRNELPDFIGVDQLKRKNALADQQAMIARQGAETDQMNAQSYRAQLDSQTQARSQQAAEQQAAQAREWLGNAVQTVRQNPALIPALVREGKMRGVLTGEIPDNITPEQVEEFALQYGIAPQQQAVPFEQTNDYAKIQAQSSAAIQLERERAANAARLERLRQQGKPAPGAAPAGKPADPIKLANATAARRQLTRVRSAIGALSGSMIDGGPADAKVLKYTKKGQEIDASNAALLQSLTTLTRIPGVGAQSDLEQRLQQLRLPSYEFSPDVNAKTVKELEAFIGDLEVALRGASSTPGTGATGDWSVEEMQ